MVAKPGGDAATLAHVRDNWRRDNPTSTMKVLVPCSCSPQIFSAQAFLPHSQSLLPTKRLSSLDVDHGREMKNPPQKAFHVNLVGCCCLNLLPVHRVTGPFSPEKCRNQILAALQTAV